MTNSPTKPFSSQNLILLLLAVFTLSSCNNKKDEGSKKVAVVISTLNNIWFVVLGKSAAERARELGYEYIKEKRDFSA